MKEFHLIIIGSGPAGHTAALTAAKHGLKTAIVEKDMNNLGGVCLNEGCIPLKGLIHHALAGKKYSDIIKEIKLKIDMLRKGLKSRLESQKIEIIQGEAAFISKEEIIVNSENIKAKNFIIAAGSAANKIFNAPCVHSAEKIFSLDEVPAKALIIGGGVIGCEYASLLNSLGAEVTIVEILDSILCGEDEEAIRALEREFKKKKLKVYAKASVKEVKESGEVVFEQGGKEITCNFDMIFESTGRKPHVSGMNLEAAGVELTEDKFIKVNEFMQTSAANIYAAGDCIDTPMLAYTAAKEAETAVEQIVTGKAPQVDYVSMPRLVFSSPRLGSAGISEKQAKEEGRETDIYKYFFKAIGKAVVEGKDAGFIKLIAENNRIIGACAVGHEIADLINETAVIIKSGISVEEIKNTMHIHPSYSEIITEALNYGKVK